MNKNDNGKVTAISDTAQPAAQSIQLKRPALTLSAALSGLLVFSSSLPALAWAAGQPVSQAAVTTFAIPAGSLSHALQALANEANVMLVFTPDQTGNKTSQGLQGQFSVQSAFNQLLAGSGLQAVQEGQSYRLVNLSQTASGEEPLVVPELSVVTSMNDSMVVGRSTLKKENIERLQADNVAALLDKLPGVSSAGSPRPGGQSLNIWGMGGAEDVKITLDGAPKGFEKYRQGSVFIEPELIKQIDVDKGPFNLANGNGGFGGSIKIETKDASDLLQPGENFGGMAKYSFHTNDNQNIYSGALYGRTQEGLADGLLYMSKRDGGDIMRPDNTRFAYSANKQGTYLAKSNIYLTEAQTLTLSGMYSEANGWQPFAAKRDELAAPSEADIEKYGYDGAWKRKLVYREQTDQNYSVKWNLAPADNPWIDLTLNYGYSKTKQHDKRPDNASVVFLGSLGNESWVDYTDNLVEGSNKSRFSTGPIDHLLEIGTSWHQNKRNTMMYNGANKKNPAYNYGFFQPYYMPAGKEQVSSLYLQDAMTLGTVTVTPGIRYDNVLNEGQQNVATVYNSQDPKVGHDYSSKRYTGLTPALGLLWKATPNISLFADVTRTWRAPTIDEQYSVQYASSNISGSSRDLQVEKINSVRGGVILNYDNVLAADDSLQVRTTVFRNRGKNEIFWRRGVLCEAQKSNDNAKCGTPLSNYRNLPGYTIEGLEIESFYDSRRIFGSLSFSTIHGDRDASPRDPWGNKTWLPEIPPTTVHTTLGVKIPEVDMALGWTTDLVRKQDRSPVEGDPLAGIWSLPKTKGYALQGLFATWQPKQMKGLEVRVAVDNLFNTNYYPYLGESVSGVGRNIKFSLSQKF